MPQLRDNTSAFASGVSKYGKNQVLWDYIVSRYPRVISLDSQGDTWDRNPNAVQARSVAHLKKLLLAALRGKWDAWHFVLPNDQDVACELFALLSPADALQGPDAPATGARVFGGVMIECGEVYNIAPAGGTPRAIKAGWTQSRHHLLSVATAGNRPALTDRTLTANSDHLFAFTHNVPQDFAYYADVVGPNFADEMRSLDKYEFVYWRTGSPIAWRYDKDRRLVREIPLRSTLIGR